MRDDDGRQSALSKEGAVLGLLLRVMYLKHKV